MSTSKNHSYCLLSTYLLKISTTRYAFIDKVYVFPAVSSSRYDNTSGGAIEVISPASSPVQSQQDKPEEGQQQAGKSRQFTNK